jgi:predicted dehydrogenase/aryl-alcohol dehydrogenase-like predicted oxidoreductase
MLNWGILSTGRIASVFAKGLLRSRTGALVAVASRNKEEAQKFGIEKHGDFLKGVGGVARHGSYEEMLADKNVRAVYIATPHPLHAVWAIRCAEAGKHILCEKPIAVNHAEAMAIFEAARANGVFAMEAFMYRCHPMIAKILELVRAGAVGQVRAIDSKFSFNTGPNWTGRLLANELGGGGILDVGCYPMSFVRAVAGVALGLNIAVNPSEVRATGQLTQTGVDGVTTAALKFDSPWGGIIASVTAGVQVGMENASRIYGSDGTIIMTRWVPSEKENKITLIRGDKTEEIEVSDGDDGRTVYTMEADEAARAIGAGEKQGRFPAMNWNDTLGNMKALDAWRAQIGLTYESEKPARQVLPVNGRPLIFASVVQPKMPYGNLPGVKKEIARIGMGADNQVIEAFPHAAAMFDDYFSRGGNLFDVGHIYQSGRCERALGAWIKNRGVREKVVVLGKGAHTPCCDPKGLTRELTESLERLEMDYVDIYMLHRDNLDVPVAEFVDVLDAHVRAGRMRAIGASNWTIERVEEFNEDAKKRGKSAMIAMSNNLALSVMNNALWHGCLTAHDEKTLAWHEKTQMPLIPWSSQGRRFFTTPDPADPKDGEMIWVWHSKENMERRARATELALKKECKPIQIALAWVLLQPFPTFPLIGPRSIEETRVSLDALNVSLTASEMKWLDLRE